jgi:putative SOS response-associated peptidase YedK
MCNFYDAHSSSVEVEKAFEATSKVPDSFNPSYNVRPTGSSYVVRINEEGNQELNIFSFGLLPSWAKDRNMQYSTINARDDKLMESNL